MYYQDKYLYTSKFYNEPISINKKPIISRELFEKARNQCTKNKSLHGRVSTAVYILTGKMRCKKCGSAYAGGRWHNKKLNKISYYYRDLGRTARVKEYGQKCTGVSIKKDLVENIIKNDIKEFLINPKTLEGYLDNGKKEDNTLTDIEYQIIKNDSEMGKLIDLYAEMFIPDPVQEKVIKERIKQIQGKARTLQALKFEAENKAEALKLKRNKIEKISYLLKKISEGIEKLEDWEWKRLIYKLVDKIEIDSIGAQGKTIKLDIYITYNFDEIISQKTSYYTNHLSCK